MSTEIKTAPFPAHAEQLAHFELTTTMTTAARVTITGRLGFPVCVAVAALNLVGDGAWPSQMVCITTTEQQRWLRLELCALRTRTYSPGDSSDCIACPESDGVSCNDAQRPAQVRDLDYRYLSYESVSPL